MNTKEELQFNDVVLISKQKCISIANSEKSTEENTRNLVQESNSEKRIKHSTANTLLDNHLKSNELKARMPNIKVFSGNVISIIIIMEWHIELSIYFILLFLFIKVRLILTLLQNYAIVLE